MLLPSGRRRLLPPLTFVMARRDRSYSPDSPNKRVRPSHRSSPRSPSPTRRNAQRPIRSRYDDDRDRDRDRDGYHRERDRERDRDRERERERERDRERDRDRDRDRDRYRDDRYRDDRRRDYRDDRRDDRRRSRSRDRRDRDRPASPHRGGPPPAESKPATPPVEDEKLKAKRARLEAWKKERDAKKALDEAKAKAMALAGKSAAGEQIHILLCISRFHTT